MSPQPELPPPVADRRRDVVAAAAACDYEQLAALTASERFTYSFGEDDRPAEYWRRAEARGDMALRVLVGLLDGPYAEREGGQYVWPSAFAYDTWDEIPAAEREALRPFYDDEDFESFAAFGAYIGYRMGITEEGEWIFFVEGD